MRMCVNMRLSGSTFMVALFADVDANVYPDLFAQALMQMSCISINDWFSLSLTDSQASEV